MPEETTLTQEDRKRLDRQRFIGIETQKRVLISPANGINTELAKNLILAGVNVSIYDDHVIDQDDYQTNFLIAKSEIGQKRGEAVLNRLKEMNPSGKNFWFDQNVSSNPETLKEEFFKEFTIIVTSLTDFDSVRKWDGLSKKLNLPYYNQVACGLYAYSFISLGSHYQYKEPLKKESSGSKAWTISSLSIDDCLNPANLNKAKESLFLTAVMMMNQAQKAGLSYDPFFESQSVEKVEENQKNLNKIVEIGCKINESEKHSEFFNAFAKTFGINYCPVYSVIGSIVSQQIIKIAQNQSEPGINWLFYESQEGYGSIFKVKAQQQLIKSDSASEKQENLEVL